MANFTFIPNSNHQAGVLISSTITMLPGISAIEAHIVGTAWATASPSIVLTCRIDSSGDGGSTWQTQFQAGWVGGSVGRDGSLPSFRLTDIDQYVGQRVRIYLEQSGGPLRYSIQGSTS